MNFENFQQLENQIQPHFFYIDNFLPKLIEILSEHWNSIKDLLPEFQLKINNFEENLS